MWNGDRVRVVVLYLELTTCNAPGIILVETTGDDSSVQWLLSEDNTMMGLHFWKSSPPDEIAFLPLLSFHTPPTHLYYLLSTTIFANEMLSFIDEQQ